MVAFLKLANVFGLCLLAVKAASLTSTPSEQGIAPALHESVISAANASAVVAGETKRETGANTLKARQSFLAITTYVCITLGADVNFNARTTGLPLANGQTVNHLAAGTCICVYIDIDPLNGFNPIQVAVYLSDGTQLSGSAATKLGTSIFSSQCGLLSGYTGCGSFSNSLGVVSANQANAGVCIYAKLPFLPAINTGFNADAVAAAGISGLRPSAGANVGLATTGFSQCCALQCSSTQFVCGGLCVANTNTCQSGKAVPKTNTGRRGLKRGADQCPAGKTACPVPGTRSWDCIDTDSDVETCGGCVNPLRPNARNSGVDCTAIAGAGEVACVRGKCQIRSCAPRFALSADGNSCERLSALRKNKDVLKKARRS